ncbi:MAG: glycosyltransferase [Bacteroidota bacterium]
MNICFLNAIHELGGGELWVLRACEQLPQWGVGVSVICPYGSPLHIQCVERKINVFTYQNENGTPFVEPIYHFLQKNAVDVLYCTVIGTFHEAEVLSRIVHPINQERTARRLALILKTGLPKLPAATPDFYGGFPGSAVRRLHVVSQSCKRSFDHWHPDLSQDFIEVNYEGIDWSVFDPTAYDKSQALTKFQLPEDRFTVSYISRLVPMKGHDHLLVAFHTLAARHPHLQLVLAGEGPCRPDLEQQAAQLGIQDCVFFLGQIDDVPALLAASDLICHPSLNDGLPNALVEAIAMQTPVVASKISGIPELIDHEESGLLFPPGDTNAIVAAIEQTLAHPERAREMAQVARQKAHTKFDQKHNFRRLVERLQEEQAALDQIYPLKSNPLFQEVIPILFVMTNLRTGGEETEISLLAQHLDRRKFDLQVLSCSAVDEASFAPAALREAQVVYDTHCHALNSAEEKVGYIVDYIQRKNIRVVVACQDVSLAYHAVSRLPKEQVVFIEHGGIPEEALRVPKDRTDCYIGVSQAIADVARPLLAQPERAVFLPSMVDFQRYNQHSKAALREAYQLPTEACIVLFVGRLDAKKRVEIVLEAAARILAQQQNALFLIIGPPDAYQPQYARLLYQLAEPLTATGRLLFTGARDDVPLLMAASNVLALPALGEGMSHVINEAGAAGLAVVASASGAAAEQLQGGAAGRLIPEEDKEGFIRALVDLVADPVAQQHLGRQLQQRVQTHYSAERVIPQWAKLLEELAPGPIVQQAPAIHIPKEDIPPFPLEIQIQSNTRCNASCIMCPYPIVSKEFPHSRMSEELYLDILNQCSRESSLRRIEPFLMNDPFTDKRMVDWITMAKQFVPHAMVTLTTNGAPLVPKVADRLIHSGLDAIWFSFNGATKATYEKIMGISFDRVKRNIDYLLSIKPPSLQVFTNMIDMNEMKGEIEENIRHWMSKGVGSGSSVLVNRGGNLGNFEELNYKPQSDQPIKICDLLFHKMYILYNGDAVLCCMDWRRQVVMGNVMEQSIQEIWQGEKYQHFRRLHIEGRSEELPLCSTCSYCHN